MNVDHALSRNRCLKKGANLPFLAAINVRTQDKVSFMDLSHLWISILE
jgi:hypothetical protein